MGHDHGKGSMTNLAGKVPIVTGAGRGVDTIFRMHLGRQRAGSVARISRTQRAGSAGHLDQRIESVGARLFVVPADLRGARTPWGAVGGSD